jgi:Tfp pilus assembly protein FimT
MRHLGGGLSYSIEAGFAASQNRSMRERTRAGTRRKNTGLLSSAVWKRQRAITLLEMAIALFILLMFLGLAAVQLRGYRERQELEYAARRVELGLRELHHRSVRQQQPIQVRIDWKNNRLAWSELTRQSGFDQEGQPKQRWTEFETLYEVAEPVRIARTGNRRDEDLQAVYFYPNGRCSPAEYRFEHGKTGESVSLHLIDWSGEIRMISNS